MLVGRWHCSGIEFMLIWKRHDGQRESIPPYAHTALYLSRNLLAPCHPGIVHAVPTYRPTTQHGPQPRCPPTHEPTHAAQAPHWNSAACHSSLSPVPDPGRVGVCHLGCFAILVAAYGQPPAECLRSQRGAVGRRSPTARSPGAALDRSGAAGLGDRPDVRWVEAPRG